MVQTATLRVIPTLRGLNRPFRRSTDDQRDPETGRPRTTASGWSLVVPFDARLMPYKLVTFDLQTSTRQSLPSPLACDEVTSPQLLHLGLGALLSGVEVRRPLDVVNAHDPGGVRGNGLGRVEEDRRHAGCDPTDVSGGDDRVEPIGFAAEDLSVIGEGCSEPPGMRPGCGSARQEAASGPPRHRGGRQGRLRIPDRCCLWRLVVCRAAATRSRIVPSSSVGLVVGLVGLAGPWVSS
jgi:hypothetical protein